MRRFLYLTLCSLYVCYCFSLEYIADPDDSLPFFTFCNDSDQPIWIGITSGENVIFKGEIRPKSETDHQSHLYQAPAYDREKNSLGLNLKSISTVAIWLKNPSHACKYFDFWYDLPQGDHIRKICVIWHGRKAAKPLDIRYFKDRRY